MNAFIVAQQRTGSTLLYEFIDSHPGIFCADELFIKNPRPMVDYRLRMIKVYNWYKNNKGWNIDQYLEWIFSLSQHACIKILYHQVNHFRLRNKVFSTSVIHLTRRNYFHRTISNFKTTANTIEKKSPVSYIRDMEEAIRKDKEWGEILKKNCSRYMKLHYEDLVGRRETVRNIEYTFIRKQVGERICKFFNVPYFEMFTATQKALKKKDYWEYIPEKFRGELKERLSVFPPEVWK